MLRTDMIHKLPTALSNSWATRSAFRNRTLIPNGALSSLAGNIDSHHRVAIADLILVKWKVRATVEDLIRRFDPDVVGLSIMTFQRKTANAIMDLARSLKPGVTIVVGVGCAGRSRAVPRRNGLGIGTSSLKRSRLR